MDKLLEIMNSIGLNQPVYVLAAGALIMVLVIALIVMNRRKCSEINDWSEQCRNLRDEIDSMDKDARKRKSLIAENEKEIEKAREDLNQMKEEFEGRLTAKDEETAAQLKAAEEEAVGRLSEQEEKFESVLREKEAEMNALMEQKDAELMQMQEQVEQLKEQRDAIVAEAHKQAAQIVAEANQSAMEIVEEATRRLVESEEEVRKNRLVVATSLTDARKRISEMLLSAASELCKGIPASSPIGYAPVYKIEEAEAEPTGESEEYKEE